MADQPTEINTTVGEGGKRKPNKLTAFVKKNKTLTAVVAAGGIYYLVKSQGGGGGTEEPVEGQEFPESGNAPLNEVEAVNSRDEYNELTAEERQRRKEEDEAKDEENTTREENLRQEEEELREREREKKEESAGNEKEPSDTEGAGNTGGSEGITAAVVPQEHGVSVHGRDFPGATSSRIAGQGKTEGNKAYIEYVITFPGRQEHWQFFTASGNWRKVNDSSGQNPGSGTNDPNSGNKSKSPTVGIGNAQPVQTVPQSDPSHPGAVNTGNKCVGGGIGTHTPPAGWHLYCSGGWIWRAPDATGGPNSGQTGPGSGGASGGNSGGGGGGGGGASCPAGTRQNIEQSRAEVNRLTGEIQQLQGYIQQHPNANQVGSWRANIASKQGTRDQFQGAVDRGRQVAGCGNV